MKIELKLEVDYVSDNEIPEEVLKSLLENIVNHASNNGLLTGETEAEVNDYSFSVSRVD